MTPLPFEAARQCVIDRVREFRKAPIIELAPITEACGRYLGKAIHADRPYPPLARSIRDGFAVDAASFTGEAKIIGEVRAGTIFAGRVNAGKAVEIMTGAPMPRGTDSIVMVEQVARAGDRMTTSKRPSPGEYVNAQASHRAAGDMVLREGQRLSFAQVGVLATVGVSEVPVQVRPKVAIISTGDELTEITEPPLGFQVRNANSYTLAEQVARAGCRPEVHPVARDNQDATRAAIEAGLKSDLLLLSGGVSAGKYDLVEDVLSGLGAEFYFTRVRVQPGQPLVFGKVNDTLFFGLPGNPVSAMVTLETIAKAALELLAGAAESFLPCLLARLTSPISNKPGLTRFLPGQLRSGGPEVTPVRYSGSDDIFALGESNCFLISRPDREVYDAGELVEVMPW